MESLLEHLKVVELVELKESKMATQSAVVKVLR